MEGWPVTAVTRILTNSADFISQSINAFTEIEWEDVAIINEPT